MIAFWLLPAPASAAVFAALIRKLARKYDAPLFDAHVTLCAGNFATADALDELREIQARADYQLDVVGVEESATITKRSSFSSGRRLNFSD